MDESSDPPQTTTRRGWLTALTRDARTRVREAAREANDAIGPGGLPGLLGQLDPFDGDANVGGTYGAPPLDGSGREPARAPIARSPWKS